MLTALKNWLNPLAESTGPRVDPPDDLPEDKFATYNPSIYDTTRELLSDTMQASATARWRVRRGDTDSGAVLDSPLAPQTPLPVSPSAGYTLHRVFARGGFGEIWEATQEVLSRVVAVKRLRQDLIDKHKSDAAALRRLEVAFRQEAIVAAYLEHPNILPVHDLGLDGAGHLLLATKLVRGRTWDDLIEGDAAMPRDEFLDKHLPILAAVARAVAFAHARGVVHRDLKPGQVMVGEFGEVLLMDWGIAMFTEAPVTKISGVSGAFSQVAPTRETATNPAGTVGYMAPEQTENTTANIGPWTDVYLLGGILYELLTGRLPHDGTTRHQSFFLASLGIVPSPWEVAPKRLLPPQLVALAMACLEPRQRERLASAEEFLRLLQEYLTGASRRREATELIGRVTAHRAEVYDYKPLAHDQSLVARALSLWPDFAEAEKLHEVLTLRYARLALRNHDLKLARLQAERLAENHPDRIDIVREVEHLEAEAASARARLDAAYTKARAAHERADRLVTFLLDDLHTSLQQVNRLDLMGKVGREALEYFESLAEEQPTADSMSKRAAACRNIGDVFRDQGNLEGAAAAYRNFQEISQRLVAMAPAALGWRSLLATACERLSGIEYLRGKLDDALRLLDQGLELMGGRTALEDDEFLVAKLTHQKGIVLWRRRQLDAAFELQTASLAMLRKLARKFPLRIEIQQAYGWNLSTLGNVWRDKGNLREAIAQTKLGLEVRQDLLAQYQDNRSIQDDVCWSVTNLGLLHEYVGDFEGALEKFDDSSKRRRKLMAEDPTNISHRNKLSFILSSRGRNFYGLGMYEQAVETCSEAVSISRMAAEADPTNMVELGAHALNLGYLGLALFQTGWLAEARAVLDESQPAARKVLASVPENGVFQNAVCQSLILEGLIAKLDGSPEHANACWEEALSLLEGQFWRRTTGQGVGMHLELCAYLGRKEEARADAAELIKNKWMMPRWAALVAE